jgi:hypothetical protein
VNGVTGLGNVNDGRPLITEHRQAYVVETSRDYQAIPLTSKLARSSDLA